MKDLKQELLVTVTNFLKDKMDELKQLVSDNRKMVYEVKESLESQLATVMEGHINLLQKFEKLRKDYSELSETSKHRLSSTEEVCK